MQATDPRRFYARRRDIGLGNIGVDKEIICMMAAGLWNAGGGNDDAVSVESRLGAGLSGSGHTENCDSDSNTG